MTVFAKLVKSLLLFVISLCLLFGTQALLAQTDSVTATPAPTKTLTPTPALTTVSGTLTAISTPEGISETVFEPFTQANLEVITGNVQRPNGIVWFNGHLYTSCTGDWTLYEINDTDGSTVTYIYGIRNAHTLYAELDGEAGNVRPDIWLPDFQANALVFVDRTSGVRTIASGLQGPWGLAYRDSSHFFITNLLGNNMVSMSRTGEGREVVTNLRSPAGVVVDGDTLYVANNGSARRAIEWLSISDIPDDEPADAEDPDVVHSLVSGIQNTTGMAMGADGKLYFAYALGTRGVVGRVNPEECRANGGCTNEQVEIVIYTELSAPLAGLTLSSDMRLFVHSMFGPDIYWVQLPQA